MCPKVKVESECILFFLCSVENLSQIWARQFYLLSLSHQHERLESWERIRYESDESIMIGQATRKKNLLISDKTKFNKQWIFFSNHVLTPSKFESNRFNDIQWPHVRTMTVYRFYGLWIVNVIIVFEPLFFGQIKW